MADICLLQVYGKDSVFDADRLIDLLAAFEDFAVASKSSRGDMDVGPPRPGSSFSLPQTSSRPQISSAADSSRSTSNGQASTSTPYNHNGASFGSNQGQAGARSPYGSYSKGNGNGMGAGSYSGVNINDAQVVANSRGNNYQASLASGKGKVGGNGQAYNGQHANEQRQLNGNDREYSGQHASSSSGGPWGSWGNWPSQVHNSFAKHWLSYCSC